MQLNCAGLGGFCRLKGGNKLNLALLVLGMGLSVLPDQGRAGLLEGNSCGESMGTAWGLFFVAAPSTGHGERCPALLHLLNPRFIKKCNKNPSRELELPWTGHGGRGASWHLLAPVSGGFSPK